MYNNIKMARTKQTARKLTGGKALRNNIASILVHNELSQSNIQTDFLGNNAQLKNY